MLYEVITRFVDFLSELHVLGFKAATLLQGEESMDTFDSFKAQTEAKFDSVELLQNLRAQEFYIVGALAQLVISWQYSKDSDTVAKYIDSIGVITSYSIHYTKLYERRFISAAIGTLPRKNMPEMKRSSWQDCLPKVFTALMKKSISEKTERCGMSASRVV